MTVEAPGFAKLVNESVRLTIGQVAELAVTAVRGGRERDRHRLVRGRTG